MLQVPNQLRNRSYTVNRFLLDQFFEEMAATFEQDASIIDIGGHRTRKAGKFDIERYPVRVDYVNIDPATEPDFLCDATAIPVVDRSYDYAVLSEVLEHVEDPQAVLQEAYRVLKNGGTLLMTTPFMFRIHGHPADYARYTDQWYENVLDRIGFAEVEVRKQGLMLSMLANQTKLWSTCASNRLERFVLRWISYYLIHRAMKEESRPEFQQHWLFGNSVLGFGVRARKP